MKNREYKFSNVQRYVWQNSKVFGKMFLYTKYNANQDQDFQGKNRKCGERGSLRKSLLKNTSV